MKRRIVNALLIFLLLAFAACSGTQTCRIRNLINGDVYWYSYVDSDGHTQMGQFTASGSTYDITGVDNAVNCGDIDVGFVLLAQWEWAPVA